MKRPKQIYQWVRVQWKDITGLASWGSPSEISPSMAYTEGWLVWEDADFIVISNCICNGEFGNRDAIPKSVIVEIDPKGCLVKPNSPEFPDSSKKEEVK